MLSCAQLSVDRIDGKSCDCRRVVADPNQGPKDIFANREGVLPLRVLIQGGYTQESLAQHRHNGHLRLGIHIGLRFCRAL